MCLTIDRGVNSTVQYKDGYCCFDRIQWVKLTCVLTVKHSTWDEWCMLMGGRSFEDFGLRLGEQITTES